MKKYFVLAATAVFALTQTASAQTAPATSKKGTGATKEATAKKSTKADKIEKAGKGDKGWKEMKTFHHFMSGTFHPAEEGNFAPLRAKADSMYNAALAWQKSPIPANFKVAETKVEILNLVNETKGIAEAVKANKPDADLLTLITQAHNTFHKITGECKIEGDKKGEKGDKDEKGDKKESEDHKEKGEKE